MNKSSWEAATFVGYEHRAATSIMCHDVHNGILRMTVAILHANDPDRRYGGSSVIRAGNNLSISGRHVLRPHDE